MKLPAFTALVSVKQTCILTQVSIRSKAMRQTHTSRNVLLIVLFIVAMSFVACKFSSFKHRHSTKKTVESSAVKVDSIKTVDTTMVNLLRRINSLKLNTAKDKLPFDTCKKWKMFQSSKQEVADLMIGIGSITFSHDTINIQQYPFIPSVAFGKGILKPADIDDVDTSSFPPTIKTGNEIIFVSTEYRKELIQFIIDNHIKVVARPDIWGWILEPFLDTEFGDELNQRLNKQLAEYGLTEEIITELRRTVKNQMMKYNFDTMLWDWTGLGAADVLKAMRTKYSDEKFRVFYGIVMQIALLNKMEK